MPMSMRPAAIVRGAQIAEYLRGGFAGFRRGGEQIVRSGRGRFCERARGQVVALRGPRAPIVGWALASCAYDFLPPAGEFGLAT
jgi:hypothetical protein